MTTSLPLANSLHRATLDALRRQAPFATMNEDEVLWLIQRLSVAYFERDAVLLEPADAPPDTLFIIKQGTVGGVTADGQTVFQLATGEIFPLEVERRDGTRVTFAVDEHPRRDTSM